MLKKIIDWIRDKKPPKSDSADRTQVLLRMLSMTEAHEMACDDVHLVLAEFAEMHQRGEDVAQLMPHVTQHLEMCPDCQEEFDALMAMLASEKEIWG